MNIHKQSKRTVLVDAQGRKNIHLLVLTFPSLLLLFIFVLYPTFSGMFYSFTSWDGVSSSAKWIGIRNYLGAAHDSDFVHSVWFTIKFTFVNVFVVNLVGLLLALLLENKFPSFMRAIFFLPNVIATVISVFIWSFIFSNVFSEFYKVIKIPFFKWDWFGQPSLAFTMIIIISIWISSGYFMLIYLTGLKNVPSELTEAAKIDGASNLMVILKVKIPLLMPSVVIGVFLATLGSLRVFDLIYALTGGGPFNSTQTIALNIYSDAFTSFNFGLASAKSMILFALVMVITFLEVYYLKRRENV